MILKDISITLGGTDLSSSLRGLEMEVGAEAVAAEAHGDDWRWFEKGLETGVITCQFKQDFTSGGVDDTISGLADTFTVVIKPTSGSASSSNPSFTATMMVENYQRFTGTIGDLGICTLQLALAADTGVVRAES